MLMSELRRLLERLRAQPHPSTAVAQQAGMLTVLVEVWCDLPRERRQALARRVADRPGAFAEEVCDVLGV